MASIMFLIVSLVAIAQSALIPSQLSAAVPAYVPGVPINSSSVAIRPQSHTVLSIPLSVIATSDDAADDVKSVVEAVKETVSNVAEKVADVVGEVRDKVSDVIDDVKDKISDVVDDTKTGGNSQQHVDVVKDGAVGSNETSSETSKETDLLDDEDKQSTNDNSNNNSTEEVKTSKEVVSDDDNIDDKNDDSKRRVRIGKFSSDNKHDDKSNENVDQKTEVGQAKNGTEDSGEDTQQTAGDKDAINNSEEKDDKQNVWSWFKRLTDDLDNESVDDDTKIKRYLTKISEVRGYLDAIDSNIAVSRAKHSGTCPVYPVQVGNNRVTITTQNGCKIVIKLRGLTVDKITDGHEEVKKRGNKRSVLVSYSDDY